MSTIILLKRLKQSWNVCQQMNIKLGIRADRRPAGEHERRFNTPQVNEVAVVISGGGFHQRDIVIQR
jgi:hypothetical protein